MPKKPKKVPTTLEDAPIGVLDDGKINLVNRDDPPFVPTIVDDDGNVIDEGDEGDGGEA